MFVFGSISCAQLTRDWLNGEGVWESIAYVTFVYLGWVFVSGCAIAFFTLSVVGTFPGATIRGNLFYVGRTTTYATILFMVPMVGPVISPAVYLFYNGNGIREFSGCVIGAVLYFMMCMIGMLGIYPVFQNQF